MKRKKLISAVVITVLTALCAWLAAPSLVAYMVKSKAKERGWDVSFESVVWSSSEVKLQRVTASNAWVQANLDEVVISVDGTQLKAVHAKGGKAVVDVSKRPKGESKGSIKTSAENMAVEVAGVCGNGRVHAMEAGKSEDGAVWAARASGTCAGWSADMEGLRRSEGLLKIERASIQRIASGASESDKPKLPEPAKMTSIPDMEVRVGELRVGTASSWMTATAVRLSKRSGEVDLDAEVVTAGVTPEWGEVTAKQASVHAVIEDPLSVSARASSIGGGVEAIAKDQVEARSVYVAGTVSRAKDGGYEANGVTLKTGSLEALVHVRYTDRQNLRVDVNTPKTSCQAALDSAPPAFVDRISGFKMSGTLQPEVHVEGKDGKFDVQLGFQNRCKVESVPELMSVKVFSKPFRRSVPGVKGPIEVESGPGSDEWTPADKISPFMAKAVMTTEDTGFLVHHGFVEQSIASSMKENLEKGHFARGGSTISMQLAKNLWLSRTKTISRKAQEFFLTTYLEQSLKKEEIMELYLNVIEYGPEVYGIRQASAHYFGKSPAELTVSEAAFLASLLPSPKRDRFSKEGKLTGGWDQWVKNIVRLMRKHEYITEQEEVEGLAQEVVFGGGKPVQSPGGVDPKSWQ